MTDRREFLRTLGAAAAVPAFSRRGAGSFEEVLAGWAHQSLAAAAGDEEFWETVRGEFRQSPAFVNLENGYLSPQPESTLRVLEEEIRAFNLRPSHYMRRDWNADRQRVTRELAELAGCGSDELVITRNTTEALGTVIAGLPWREGDEAVMTDQDYGTMLEQFRQVGRRHRVKCVEIPLPLHPGDDEEIVQAYERAITPRTRVLLVTHMINLTGQILPARKIAEMAHARGVEVILDAAHSFAHIEFEFRETGCDYLGASLHKWLCTPAGAGILIVRREKIAGVWPLLGETSLPADDIRKFERLGTQPAWILRTIPEAIRFHRAVGPARKEARLRSLQQRWTSRAAEVSGVTLNTPGGTRSCAIANVAVEGKSPAAVSDALFERHRIYTVPIDHPTAGGVRVTPHLYTRPADLDALVDALAAIARGKG